MSDYLDPANEELLKDFFVEADSQVDALEQNILVLENDSSNADAIDEIFRAAHTLKGASATVQMDELTEFTHLVEDVFETIRSDHGATVADTMIDTLLQSIDIIKEMLSARRNGSIYSGNAEPVKNELRSLLSSASKSEHAAPAGSTEANGAVTQTAQVQPGGSGVARPGSQSNDSGLSEHEVRELIDAADPGHTVYGVKVEFNEDNPMNTVGGIQIFAALKDLGTVLRTEPDFESLYEDKFHPVVIYWLSTESTPDHIEDKAAISDVVDRIDVSEVAVDSGVSEDGQASATGTQVSETAAHPSPATQEQAAKAKASDHATTTQTSEELTSGTTQSKAPEAPQKEVSETAATPQASDKDSRSAGKRKEDSGSVLRVDSRRIDDLLNLVSETVIIKAGFNQLSEQFTGSIQNLQNVEQEYRDRLKELFDSLPDYLQQIQDGASVKEVRRLVNERFGDLYNLFDRFEGGLKTTSQRFRASAQNLGRVTGELQEGVMRIRMVPISQIFSRFPRLVRDLSKSLNKNVTLHIEGEETELDKSVIEDLLDPLIHCARNSIDHGIESPQERLEAGKPEQGNLTLKASNEGNMIIIEVYDDGRGIDINEVRRKAIDRGVIHPEKNLSDVEAFNLIFDPGFSTAKQITNVSGRGVGLDVVQQQIKKLNGSVSVWSESGLGSRFTIKIPLTLAIIQGLLVRVGKEMYAIPITSVLDSHRIRPSDIKLIDNYEVFNVRDDVVSLIRLSRLFRIPTEEKRDYHFVVVVGTSERKMGLIVDELIGEEDVVIKPLRDHYTNVPGIAGANITGDGTVSLIIDVSQLLDLGLQQEREQRLRRETPSR